MHDIIDASGVANSVQLCCQIHGTCLKHFRQLAAQNIRAPFERVLGSLGVERCLLFVVVLEVSTNRTQVNATSPAGRHTSALGVTLRADHDRARW
ncbi:hypothetical protein PILCRDRAFT_815793 [Piloderma croceum F 1598]|uniref:Uncharacterized protein n=1 Tax=Piloderma croceum (strain F 1598) TaxID=765440 RepID=A0A0C3FQX3_PILCF|nr:hypothetical protein PILCRDRAFT_815793 [Piloderma croceum F 1598]